MESCIQKKLKFDISYMRMAHVWSENSHCVRKKVGALIVKDGVIISDGYNGSHAGTDNCCEDSAGETKWQVVHAEANAILKLARSNNSSEGSTLYITLSPCKECSKMILSSNIKRVVYGRAHSDRAGLDFLINNGVVVEQVELKTDFTFSIINSYTNK